ncbi:hypothetical protein [Clostridium sp. chh4-2]|uniref:hypothetical protein n=2 Tax=Clostridia TaxID=186801 RepID=UPI0015E185DB|nr:hypothetical protein [Clostridium sp. chh4-2]
MRITRWKEKREGYCMGHIDELKRLFENRIAMSETKFFGRTCMGRIGDGLIGKIEFHNTSGREFYPHIKVSVFERTNGMVDQITFLMMDVIGKNQKNDSAIIPALIHSEGKLVWNFDITEEDRKELVDAVNEYLGMFQSLEERQAQLQNSHALPDHVLF